ncbi:hypothetical protein V6U90_10685 [Micromonospora sp. CPCC 206060]|uniref:hypothetical protein n=1 Tax=Micromonospora sp. CPCC 206060 TaxID=3122406 RepID=UPI002FEF5F3D
MNRRVPVPGDVVLLGAAASVQFGGSRGLRLRVSAVGTAPTYHGWCWLTGYVLDAAGDAVDKREVYVQVAGLRIVPRPPRRATPR